MKNNFDINLYSIFKSLMDKCIKYTRYDGVSNYPKILYTKNRYYITFEYNNFLLSNWEDIIVFKLRNYFNENNIKIDISQQLINQDILGRYDKVGIYFTLTKIDKNIIKIINNYCDK